METYNSSYTAEQLEYALSAVPSIGANGNWYIGETDTGIFAGGIKVTGAEVGQTVKIAEVDENGMPTAWEAVDGLGDWELVGSYIHEGNTVIQPDALDITTGVFTVNAGHGLSDGDLLSIFVNDPTLFMDYNTKTKIPLNLAGQGTYALTVTVIDEYTFTLATGNGGTTTVSYTDCTAVDCSLFRFERRAFNTTLCRFNNLSEYENLRFIMYGSNDCEIKCRWSGSSRGTSISQMIEFNRTGTSTVVSTGSNPIKSFGIDGFDVTTLSAGSIYGYSDITASRFAGKTYISGVTRSDRPSTAYAGNGSIRLVRHIVDIPISQFTISMYYKGFVANGFTVEVYAK